MTKRVRHTKGLMVASLVALAGWCGSAEAETIAFDNLGSSPYHTFGYGSFGLFEEAFYDRGMQFTASDTIELSTLELALGQSFLGGVTSPGEAVIQLMTDVGDEPDAVLESWTSPTLAGPLPTNGRVETFTSVLTPTLTAGSKYWIVLSAAPESDLAGAWFFADNEHTGTTRTFSGVTGGSSRNYSTLTRGYRSRVSGNVVPEPSTLVLMGMGGALLFGRRRRGSLVLKHPNNK